MCFQLNIQTNKNLVVLILRIKLFLFRISFSIYYLKELLKKRCGKAFFIYDIACVLHKQLQVCSCDFYILDLQV